MRKSAKIYYVSVPTCYVGNFGILSSGLILGHLVEIFHQVRHLKRNDVL
jgi:hypothetical protein